MKLNIANPSTGLQKIIEIDDEKKLLPFFEKRIGVDVSGDCIGEEFSQYVFKITGGNDKQGFPMMQGVLLNHRVRLLFKKGMKCYRPRRKGQMKRKSVRGAIVGPDLSVLNLSLVKKGVNEIPGLTDSEKPRRLGPKRATKIRKLFNLGKEADVRKFVIRRQLEGRKKQKAPKIQRLITKTRLQRKRKELSVKKQRTIKAKEQQENYKKVMHDFLIQKKAKLQKKHAANAESAAIHRQELKDKKEVVVVGSANGASGEKSSAPKPAKTAVPSKGGVVSKKPAAKGTSKR